MVVHPIGDVVALQRADGAGVSGVVNQHIDTPESLYYSMGQPFRVFLAGDVGADGNRFCAQLRHGADSLLQFGFAACGQRQLCPFASIGQGDGPPNASPRARNDCYLTIQFHCVTS